LQAISYQNIIVTIVLIALICIAILLTIILRISIRRKKTNKELSLYRNNLEYLVNEQTVKLLKEKERAERSDRLKSAFLNNMPHEIRTPMNAIVGILNFIESEEKMMPKIRKSSFEIVHNNINQLNKLMGNIIDISEIETEQLALNKASVDVNEMMQELEVFFQDVILKCGKKLKLILDSSNFFSPCVIMSDHVRLRQVLSNLMDNAIKFTETGYIRFGYKLSIDGKMLYFFVKDTGIGICQSKLDDIFERFRQVDDEEKRINYGGAGLGLSLSKALVEYMGGQIGIKSEIGSGSTLHFTLPFDNTYFCLFRQ